MSYADMIASVEECEDLTQLINFIEHCQEVCAQQKSLILQADKMHNQAIDGIKIAKRQIKKVLEKQNELGVRPEGVDQEEPAVEATDGGASGEAGGDTDERGSVGRPDEDVSTERDALDRW